ncbi:TlpA family protein disulfide reductase [Paenibacillus sp. MBLB4367]|uniref:TlpA family protein disulfide reductase n=1 Tax=Paenibacillus sp. MBLB4367 TaxID=3384767 RepID=UPI003907FDE1
MFLEASQISIWIIIAIQTTLIIILIRQLKQTHLKSIGIAPGLSLPNFEVRSLQKDSNIKLSDIININTTTMLCVVSPGCKFCKEIIPELDRVVEMYPLFKVNILVVSEVEKAQNMIKDSLSKISSYSISQDIAVNKMKITSFPFGMLVDDRGVILRREIVKKENITNWLIDVPQYAESLSKKRSRVIEY